MAKILTEMPKKEGVGRTAIYPYDEWLDGQIRQLEVGEDFTAKPTSVITSVRSQAEKRGMKLRSRFAHDDKGKVNAIIIQAFTPEEVPAESNGHKEETTETVPKSTKRPRAKQSA